MTLRRKIAAVFIASTFTAGVVMTAAFCGHPAREPHPPGFHCTQDADAEANTWTCRAVR